jgi:hypothetical protein
MGSRKLWLTVTAVVLALFTVVLLGANSWLRSFLRGEKFRTMVAEQIGDLWQVEGTFSPFRWQGWSVYAEEFRATGREGSPVRTIEARRIRATLAWRELFRGVWEISSLQIGTFEVETAAVGEGAPPPSTHPSLPGGTKPVRLPDWVPQDFHLVEGAVENATWRFPGGRLQGVSLQFRPESNGWFFAGNKGSLQWPHLPSNELDAAQVRWFPTGWYLTTGRVSFREGGTVEASGEFGADSWHLRTTWKNLPTEHWLPHAARNSLRGKLQVEADTTGMTGAAVEQTTSEGTFSLQEGELRNLPLFRTIGTFTRSRQFERVPLHEFAGRFAHSAKGTDFPEVALESRGLVRISGEVFVSNRGELRGDLRAGLTPQTLQWLPGSQERVFTERDGGYLWTDVELGGTLEHPQENLTRRLLVAGGEEVIDTGSRTLRESADTAVEGVRSVLDALLPVIP